MDRVVDLSKVLGDRLHLAGNGKASFNGREIAGITAAVALLARDSKLDALRCSPSPNPLARKASATSTQPDQRLFSFSGKCDTRRNLPKVCFYPPASPANSGAQGAQAGFVSSPLGMKLLHPVHAVS